MGMVIWKEKNDMRTARRILTVLLIVNFFCGMQAGMKVENLVLVLINGVAVLAMTAREMKGDALNDRDE